MFKIILSATFFVLLCWNNIHAQIKVACVGNSITYGYGLSSPSTQSYPARLQNLLGNDYEVSNFGVSSRTLLKNGNKPYWNELQYSQAKALNPNIVIIMLGTNDAKLNTNWIPYKDEFKDDYKDLIGSFRELDSKPEIYICLLVPAYKDIWDISDTIIRKEVNPKIKQVAIEESVKLIDMYSAMSNKSQMFASDGIHPNATGTEEMAKFIYRILIQNKKTTSTINDTRKAKKTLEKKNQNKFDATVYYDLSGKLCKGGNPVEDNGFVHHVDKPILKMSYCGATSPKGTVLFFPGGNNKLDITNESKNTALFLNRLDYDVAILEYHIGEDSVNQKLALGDAQKALQLLKTKWKTLGLRSEQIGITGFSNGANLAARSIQRLGKNEQPAFIILISPSKMDETIQGKVIPVLSPPVFPSARLLTIINSNEKEENLKSSLEYTKTWIGYDGQASYNLISDSIYLSGSNDNPMDAKYKISALIKSFLELKPKVVHTEKNPAALSTKGYNSKRHQEKLKLVRENKYDLIFMGNSITHNFEKPQYQPVWNQFFAPRNALNLGFSGYRTENIIWNIENGELDNQTPKVIVLEIGTNNIDEKNYPTRHTAGQLAGGIEAIVKKLRDKLPETKIILIRPFPGSYDGPNPTSHRAILDRCADIISKLDDNKHVFYCDVNYLFLNIDGSIRHDLMGDWLHPTPKGAKLWAQAMEPLLSKLMGDLSLDTETH